MIVDNFDQIIKYIDNIPENHVLQVLILRRKKDNPEMTKQISLITDYYIRDRNHFEIRKDEMITIAKALKARIYINLRYKDAEKVVINSLVKIAALISTKIYKKIFTLTRSITSELSGSKHFFMIDCDNFTENDSKEFEEILKLHHIVVIDKLKTVNGCHYNCKPFPKLYLEQFLEDDYPKLRKKIEIKTNSPSLIYYNDGNN